MQFQFDFDEEQAQYLLHQVENDIIALHNHIACAVENPAHWEKGGHSAPVLVGKLRKAQEVQMVLRRKLY